LATLQQKLPPASSTPNTLGSAPLPQVEAGFFGLEFPGVPNDDDLAVSNNGTVVSVMNGRIAIHAATGTLLFHQSLANFANAPGLYGFDPHVVYDPEADRFVVVFLTGAVAASSTIHVLVSATGNALGQWFAYRLSGNPLHDGTWSDFPAIALSKDYLFITCNTFTDQSSNNSGFRQSVIWQLDKRKLLTGSALGTADTRYHHDLKFNGQPLFNITPVRGGLQLPSLPFYFLSNDAITANNSGKLLLLTLTSSLPSAPAIDIKACANVLPYTLPPNVRQPHASLTLGRNDARIMSAFIQGQRLQFVKNVLQNTDANPRAGVYYGQISGLNLPAPVVQAQLLPEARDAAFPAVAPAGINEQDQAVLIVYAHASPTHYPGYSAVFADGQGNISSPLRLKEGEDFAAIWGDYTGICLQYNQTGVVWVQGCVTVSTGLGGGGERRPHISKIKNPTILSSPDPTRPTPIPVFPNPAVERFQVIFSLAKAALTTITIQDLQGKPVVHLFKDYLQAGESTLSFSTNTLPNGVYFIRGSTADGLQVLQQRLVVSR
ncbi:MAG: T9SS type A sorting domain-containing protein, partial [Rufibacter sp.]